MDRKLAAKSWLVGLLLLPWAAAQAPMARGDEGMWLFNQPPRKLLKERYGFDPTDAWLEHLQKSAVRFNSGGSGSFVSADGLVMTNHHVGADCLHKLSTADNDLRQDRLSRPDARRRDQVRRPGTQRADEHRGRHRAGQRRRQAGHRSGRRPAGPPRRDATRSRRNRSTRPACAATWSRSTRAAATTSTATRSTPTCGWSSRRKRTSPSSAAIPTTSSTRATISTSASSASTRTASRSSPPDFLKLEQGRRRRTTSWSSSPAIRAAPTG